MARRRFTPIYLFVPLLAQMAAGVLCAQVPDVEVAPPVVNPQDPRRLQGAYFRPNLSPEVLNLAELTLKPEMVDSIVSCLGLLVRNFPPGKPFSLEWKSRMLGIALRLRPDEHWLVLALVIQNGAFGLCGSRTPIRGLRLCNTSFHGHLVTPVKCLLLRYTLHAKPNRIFLLLKWLLPCRILRLVTAARSKRRKNIYWNMCASMMWSLSFQQAMQTRSLRRC